MAGIFYNSYCLHYWRNRCYYTSIIISVTGTTTFTLPAGTTGQIKILVCTVAASTPAGTLTPIASANDGYDTIIFNEVGQSATLIYENSGWIVISLGGMGIALENTIED